MRLGSTIVLYGGGPGSGCNPDVGKCGRPKTSDESVGFFSPNVEENMTFEQAMKKLGSPEQSSAVAKANTLIQSLFGGGTVQSAIGDWKDGAENSAVIHVDSTDRNTLDYALATLGKNLNQKSVLSFTHQNNGGDALWTLHTGMDMQTIRKTLDKEGIAFRTLVPGADGTTVHLFDQGTKMVDSIGRVALALQSEVEVSSGQGEYIERDSGDPASYQQKGQGGYDGVISRYRQAHGLRASGAEYYPRGQGRWILGRA